MNNVDSAVDLEVLAKFSLRILIIFAAIFVLAYLTPRLAKTVDAWIKHYRQHHGKKETYGIRSIYELPPDPEETAEDPYYDLDEDADDEADEDDYLLEEDSPTEQELLPAPESTEEIHLFSYAKLDVEPYELNRKTVRFGRKISPEFEEMDLSVIAFGQKGHPAMYETVAEPDDDEDDEFDAEQQPIRYAPFVEHFFEEDEPSASAPAEPAADAEEELPWFMR